MLSPSRKTAGRSNQAFKYLPSLSSSSTSRAHSHPHHTITPPPPSPPIHPPLALHHSSPPLPLVRRLVLVTGGLLLLAQLEVLGALDDQLLLRLAVLALQAQGHLLGGLGLLVQDGLGLSAVPLLLSVVTPLALYKVVGKGREGRWMSCLFAGIDDTDRERIERQC